ncbi:MAG: hypothetical protein IJG18_09245 [Kiritimatiellae bacterium]|nr:hypothetical protein [Kiritimatiellia bacterium]
MNYQCFNDEPPPNFLMAYRMAGEAIERMGQSLPSGPENKAPYFRWLVMRPQMLFAHLVFAYRNQVFAVYVNVVNDGIPSFSAAHKKRLTEASEEFNLVPCEIQVNVGKTGVNQLGVYGSELKNVSGLINVISRAPVLPADLATDADVPMSQWERRAFAINVIERDIRENNKFEIGSTCSVLGIDPQIWFKDDKGRPCWCIVRDWIGKSDSDPKKNDFYHFIDSNKHLRPYDGYFAGVSISSAEPVVYFPDGTIVPLSKRFSAECPLYRGHNMYVNSVGLERIYVAD